MRKTIFMKNFLITTLLAACAAAWAGQAEQSAVLDAEERFAKALKNRSSESIGKLLSDDFIYQHVTGNNYSKADVSRIFGSGEITVTKSGPLKANVRDHGNTIVTYGSRYLEGALKGQAYSGNLRFVNVWVKQADGQWLLTHRNSQLVN
jgi:ketosteroid isomerase-like protein